MPLPLFKSKEKVQVDPRFLPQKSLEGVKAVIGIAAGKGGVGKSSVTINLGLALKELGYRVGILDADIYGPSTRKMLPEDQLPIQKGAFIEPALSQGIKMISMAYFRKEEEASAVRAPIANSLITQFLNNILWGELDYLLVDFPPGTGDIQLTLCQQAHLLGAIIVTTPQEVALIDVRKAMSLFNHVKIPLVGVIENMSYYKATLDAEPVYLFGKGGGQKLASESGVSFLGQIPLDEIVSSCGDSGQSLFLVDPNAQSFATQAFRKIGRDLVSHIEHLKNEKNQGVGSFQLAWKEMPTL